jgi:hypothetical protein
MRIDMKVWILAAAVAAALSAPHAATAQEASSATIAAPAADANPASDTIGALGFDSTKVTFPKTNEGDKVEVLFPFTNNADRPIRVTRVQTSCGCTSAKENQDKVIQPKASDVIKVVFDTTNKPGKNSKTVTVYTDETDKQGYVLTFEGEVVQEVFAMPRNVSFGRVPSGTAATRTVDFITLSNPPAEILSVESSDPGIQVTKAETQPYTHTDGSPGKITTLTVTLPENYKSPGGNYGSLAGTITIKTTDRKKQQIVVPVSGAIEAPFRLTPPSYMLGRLAPGEQTSATIVLASLRNQSFTVTSTKFNPPMPNAEITVLPGVTPGTQRLLLNFTAPEEIKMHTATLDIEVTTPDGATEKLTAPLRASVRSADPNAAGSLSAARSTSVQAAAPAPGEKKPEAAPAAPAAKP